VRLSVPGNILLLGEYAVLEEGGLGLSVAVDRRVRLSVQPAAGLTVRGSWPGGSFLWSRGDPGGSALVSSVVAAVDAARTGGPVDGVHIEIDSSELFDSSGRKTGLGSSAATAAGLTAALLAPPGGHAGDAGAYVALRAHREAQGGRGSGYDVMCSWHGGAGTFSGGTVPSWTPAAMPASFRIVLFPGPGPVLTPDAVRLYAAWKQANPHAARQFLEESNRLVRSFVAASVHDAPACWAACRQLGIELGDAIGVSARLAVPRELDPPGWCKAIGAGNELGACLLPEGTESPFAALDIASEGVRWEE
jgi:phosphomevalonate kinase